MQATVKFSDNISMEKINFTMEILNSFPHVERAEIIDFDDAVRKKDEEDKALFRKNMRELAGKVDLGITERDIDISRGRVRGAELHRRFMCMD